MRPGKQNVVVGVTGGSASGKSWLCAELKRRLAAPVVVVSSDGYFRSNLDDPEKAVDYEALVETVRSLRDGRAAEIREYDFVKQEATMSECQITAESGTVILVEGLFVMHSRELRELMSLKIFVECGEEERICRRIVRDMEGRGRELEQILDQYLGCVKPCYERHIDPLKWKIEDIVVVKNDSRLLSECLAPLAERIRTL